MDTQNDALRKDGKGTSLESFQMVQVPPCWWKKSWLEIDKKNLVTETFTTWDVYPEMFHFETTPPSRNSFESPNFVASKSRNPLRIFFRCVLKKGLINPPTTPTCCGDGMFQPSISRGGVWTTLTSQAASPRLPKWPSESTLVTCRGFSLQVTRRESGSLGNPGRSLKDWRFGWYMILVQGFSPGGPF